MKRLLLMLVILGLPASSAFATLGESASSIDKDQLVLSGVRQNQAVAIQGDFSVEQIKAYHGLTLREYVNADNVVFAVAWSGGRRNPDLKQLLGSYYGEFHEASVSAPHKAGQRNHAVAKSDGVVVETHGHMGNLQGRAYLPALLPQGVNPNEIN